MTAVRSVGRRPSSPSADPRPDLRPAPGPDRRSVRRRWAAAFVVTLGLLSSMLMLGAGVLHTRLAERQARIDQIERSVRKEQDRFALLRAERAELRSPVRLAAAARAMGMNTAGDATFVRIPGIEVARALAAGADLGEGSGVRGPESPLDQVSRVKEVQAP